MARIHMHCLAIIALGWLILTAGCNRYKVAKEQATEPITAVRVTTPLAASEVELSAPLSGVVRASGQVEVAFQIPGLIMQVLVDEGETVTKGQVLAELDTRIYTAQASQAQGALDAARAQLALAEAGTRAEDIATAQAQLTSAEAVFDRALADYQRTAQLFEDGVFARQALDQAQSGLTQAEQAVNAATEQLTKARKGPRDEEIDAARASVQAAEGSVLLATTQLEYATLVAPSEGTVVSRQLEPGQSIAAGQPVIELADLTALEVWTEIPEGDLARLSVGDAATVTFPADAAAQGSAEIFSIAPNAQMQTRGFPVKLRLQLTELTVVPGMVALVQFDYMNLPHGVAIPQRSIVDGAVFIVEAGHARRIEVSQLLDKGELVIVDGLAADTQVMVNGQHYVKDGDAVNVVDAMGIEEITKLQRDEL